MNLPTWADNLVGLLIFAAIVYYVVLPLVQKKDTKITRLIRGGRSKDETKLKCSVYTVLILLLIPGLVFAGGKENEPEPIKLEQEQDQSQVQEQQQEQEQSQTMGSQENSQTVIFTSPDDVTIRNTASANPPNVSGSHACGLGKSGGFGIPAVNVSGGKQRVDPECVRREEARLLNAFGERELAVIHLCNSPSMIESLGEACGPSVTQEELRRRIDFLLKERDIENKKCDDQKNAIIQGACQK